MGDTGRGGSLGHGWQKLGRDDDLNWGLTELEGLEGDSQEGFLDIQVRLVTWGEKEFFGASSLLLSVTSPLCPF